MQIVQFISDWTLYAAGDQAAFADPFAAGLVQKGIARMIGPVPEEKPAATHVAAKK